MAFITDTRAERDPFTMTLSDLTAEEARLQALVPTTAAAVAEGRAAPRDLVTLRARCTALADARLVAVARERAAEDAQHRIAREKFDAGPAEMGT